MPSPIALTFLALIVALGAIVRGVTGLGPALLLMSIGAIALAPQHLAVVSAALDVVGGSTMLWVLSRRGQLQIPAWPPTLAAAAGALVGSLAFNTIPSQTFRMALGIFIILCAIAMLLGIQNPKPNDQPRRPAPLITIPLALAGGLVGGLVGVSGPLIAMSLYPYSSPDRLRPAVAVVLLLAAVIRVTILASTGVFHAEELTTFSYLAPFAAAPVLLGEKLFHRLSPIWASRAILAVVLFGGIYLVAT